MKIKDIHISTLKAPLKNPFITSLRRVEALEDIVVIIECDDGTVGYGEGAPTPVITGETMGSIVAAIEYIKPFILGLDIEEFDIFHKFPLLRTWNSGSIKQGETFIVSFRLQRNDSHL